MSTYRIVRLHKDSPERLEVLRGLTLEEAQAHCSDPETSSSTCKGEKGEDYTAHHGAWFDAYEEE